MFYHQLVRESVEMNDNTVKNISTPVNQQCAVPSHVQRVELFVDGAVLLRSYLYILLKTVDTIVARSKVKVHTKVNQLGVNQLGVNQLGVNQLKRMDSHMDKAMVTLS